MLKMKGRAGLLWAGVAFVLAVGIAAFACTGSNGQDDLASPAAIRVITPLPSPTPVPPTPTPTPTTVPDVCSPNPDPAPPSLLQVQEPRPKTRVKSPFHVRGWGSNVLRDNKGVEVGLVNANGEVVADVAAPPQTRANRALPSGIDNTEFTAPFGVDLFVNVSGPTPYCVWVFERSAEDDPVHIVQVPVLVVPPNDPSVP